MFRKISISAFLLLILLTATSLFQAIQVQALSNSAQATPSPTPTNALNLPDLWQNIAPFTSNTGGLALSFQELIESLGILRRLALLLSILSLIQLVWMSVFARFEVETLAVRKILTWLALYAVTLVTYIFLSFWPALGLALVIIVVRLGLHIRMCRVHGFHPLTATPRRKYYQFKNWRWPED